jgi:hypothetical protein
MFFAVFICKIPVSLFTRPLRYAVRGESAYALTRNKIHIPNTVLDRVFWRKFCISLWRSHFCFQETIDSPPKGKEHIGLTHRLPCTWGKRLQHQLNWRRGGPHSRFGHFAPTEKWTSFPWVSSPKHWESFRSTSTAWICVAISNR